MTFGQHKLRLESLLAEMTGKTHRIDNVQAQSGGSINEAYSFNFGDTRYFIKENSVGRFPQMFEKEKAGLETLSQCGSLVIPKPLLVKVWEDDRQSLILEYLAPLPATPAFYEKLGRGLAQLHKISSTNFGFEADNYMGSLPQKNNFCTSWSDFFFVYRLQPLVQWCFEKKLITSAQQNSFERLYAKLDEIFPGEPPSLLHGDLWSGNVMNTVNGPSVYDPAVYYGHREMDLAMTRLFGAFGDAFYNAYEEEYSLEKGAEQRVDICNLYPLLVHVKLFGNSYLSDVLETVKRF